jgi:hypothetical protein
MEKSKSFWMCHNINCDKEDMIVSNYAEMATIGVPMCPECGDMMEYVNETSKELMDQDRLYVMDTECYALCHNEAALEQYAKDGYWKNIAELEDETGIDREELFGQWFLIYGESRVTIG